MRVRRILEVVSAKHCFKISNLYVKRMNKYMDKIRGCENKAKKWFEKGCKFLNGEV